jgi:hypothetical protein
MMKKTVLATAVAFALAGSPVWAQSTTIDGKFILDRTEVNAGGVVNLALMGLNEAGGVDRYAEQGGYTIVATVSSIKGTVMNGVTQPDLTSGTGSFARSVRYIELTQGNGRIHIVYPPNASGKDTLSIRIQARSGNQFSGFNYVDIPGASTTKEITVVPVDVAPKGLRITGFTPAPSDSNAVTDLDNSDGISGVMTAGTPGAQIAVEARNPNAAGEVTLTVVKGGQGGSDVSYTQNMVNGLAIFTLDSKVVRAGTHKVEAVMGGVDSVGLIYPDTIRVLATGIPRSVRLYAADNKTKVIKPDDSVYNPTTGDCQSATAPSICQGIRVRASLLDEYGNRTSNRAGRDISLEIKDTATDKIVSDTALRLQLSAADGSSVAVSGDDILGNKKDEFIRIGQTKLVATPVDANGQVIATIAPSAPFEFEVTNTAVNATILPSFSTAPIAGTEVRSAFNVVVVDARGTVSTTQPLRQVSVTNLGTSEKIDVVRQSEGANLNNVDVLFTKATTTPARYLISDTAGNYGQTIVEGAPGILTAALTGVKIVNAHEKEINSILPGSLNTADQTYTVTIPEVIFKMSDAYGNPVTAPEITRDLVGEFIVNSSNGDVMQADGDFGIPGRGVGKSATVTYSAAGEKAFAGEDVIGISYTKPGLGNSQSSINTTVSVLQSMESIATYIEQTDIPINSEVAMTVEVLDQNGKIFVDTEASQARLVKINISGTGDKPIHDPVIMEIVTDASGEQRHVPVVNGQALNFSETRGRKVFLVVAGPIEGQFTVSFSDADGKVNSQERIFNVTSILQEVCSESSLAVCTPTTVPTCEEAGGYYSNGDAMCYSLPMIEEGVTGAVDASGRPVESATKIRGGCMVAGSNAIANNAVAGGIDVPMALYGSIEADPADVNKAADLLFLAETEDETGNTFFYSVYTTGLEANVDEDNTDPANGFNDYKFEPIGLRMFVDPETGLPVAAGAEGISIANYEAFQKITLKPRQSFKLFDWDLGTGAVGKGRFFFGYRLANGKIVVNGSEVACAAQQKAE